MRPLGSTRAGIIAALTALAGCGGFGAGKTETPLAGSAQPPGTAIEVPPEAPRAAAIDWASAGGDCRAQLRLLHGAARAGQLPPDSAPPFAVVVAGEAGAARWLDDGSSFIEADLPVPVGVLAPESAPCVLRIGPARALEAEHSAMGEEVVPSEYQSGTRTQRNPDYDEAVARVRRAERELRERDSGILKVGDPMLDLIGVLVGSIITGFTSHGDEEELDAAMEELSLTPRSLDQPVLRPYHFERTVVRARKSAVVPVALVDHAGRALLRTEIRQHEERRFDLLECLDPRDPDYQQHRAQSITRSGLDQWDRLPPRLAVSSIVAALVDDGHGGGLPLTVAAGSGGAAAEPDTARWPIGSAAVKTSLLDLGTVRISAGPGAPGHGFYVAPHDVITAESLVRGASLVDVTTADGDRVLGLVTAVDPTRGLALIHVPKPGVPALLTAALAPPVAPGAGDGVARAAAYRPGRAAPAGGPGTPVFHGPDFAGMVGGGGTGRSMVPAATISAFLAEHGKAPPAPP